MHAWQCLPPPFSGCAPCDLVSSWRWKNWLCVREMRSPVTLPQKASRRTHYRRLRRFYLCYNQRESWIAGAEAVGTRSNQLALWADRLRRSAFSLQEHKTLVHNQKVRIDCVSTGPRPARSTACKSMARLSYMFASCCQCGRPPWASTTIRR